MSVSFLSVAFSSARFLLEDGGAVAAAELVRPGDQRAVAGDLVVLDSLRGGDQGGVHDLRIVDVAGDLFGFLDDAVDRRAIDGLGLDVMQLEHLLEPLDVALGFLQVLLEALLQCGVACLADHLRQCLGDLLLGIIDVAQRVHEEIVERFDVLREEAHCFVPFCSWMVADRPRRQARDRSAPP